MALLPAFKIVKTAKFGVIGLKNEKAATSPADAVKSAKDFTFADDAFVQGTAPAKKSKSVVAKGSRLYETGPGYVATWECVNGSWVVTALVTGAADAAPATEAAPAKAAAKDDDDSDDGSLFGDSDEELDEEALKAEAERKAKLRQAAEERSAKKAAIARSEIIFDVKPWGLETDLEALAGKIRALEIEGCKWGEAHKLVPLAFGINALRMSCIVFDNLCGQDDVTEPIEAFEDDVQSIDIFSFNKM